MPAQQYIKVLFDQWDNETKTVFSSTPNHKVINKKIGQIRSGLERHFDLIQAKDIVATPLRFFFANEVTFNQGVPLKTVSKMLGHRGVKTTEIYVRANKHNIAENMQMVKGKLFDREGNLKTKSNIINVPVLKIVR